MTAGEAIRIQLAHTAQLDAPALAAARDLMYVVFEDMTEDDWDHALGGMHTLAWYGETLVGHASLVQRRLLHAGRALRAGYVEAVGVHPTRQRQGVGAALMEPLEDAIRRAYDLGALGATDEGARFYASRGWRVWRGPCSVLTADGVAATPEERGAVFVLEGSAELDIDGELTCDWRDGDVW